MWTLTSPALLLKPVSHVRSVCGFHVPCLPVVLDLGRSESSVA